ncbi:MAG: HNH endonuclease [Candidatus Contendobacter sp.]|nr:HNH endonuclease [Candidatus Contendobacter sp.]
MLCIYCQENSFDPGKGSEEHAILSSLGGRKASRNICCQECNKKLGDEIDKPFADEFAFFSTMLDITTGRNKDAPTHKEAVEHDGLAFDMKPGGVFKLSKASVALKDQPDGSSEISITAGSQAQALALIEQVLKKYGKSIDDFQSLEAKSVKSYLPKMHKKISLGGSKQFRAVAKMLLTYLATLVSPERLRNGTFNDVVAYINGNNDTFSGVNFGSRVLLPANPQISDINHRAFIIASSEKRLAVGVLELFGYIKYTVELTSAWDGPDISKVYLIDPVDCVNQDSELELHLPSTFANYDCYEHDVNLIVAGIESVIHAFQERQTNQQINLMTAAVIERHMVGKGDVVTKEMITNVASDLALEFVKFLHRIESEDTIDLKKLISKN